VWPETKRRRFWNHRRTNLMDKLPAAPGEAGCRLYDLYQAPSGQACETKRDELAAWLHGQGQESAAQTLLGDLPRQFAYEDRTTAECRCMQRSDSGQPEQRGLRTLQSIPARSITAK
jgi:hypothetical protein